MVLQFIPLMAGYWIAVAATLATGVYCATSNKPKFAHIWLSIIKGIGTILAIVAILRFYSRKKALLKSHKAFTKLFAFKGIIGLSILQTVRYASRNPELSIVG